MIGLASIRRRQQRLQRDLLTLASKERELVAKDELEQHPQYQKQLEAIRKTKRELHVARVRIAKKRLSIETQEKRLQKTRHQQRSLQDVERQLAQALAQEKKLLDELQHDLVFKLLAQSAPTPA